MNEIILSFFAAIGIALLTIKITDHFFYRKKRLNTILIVDLQKNSTDEILLALEAIASSYQSACGKAVISHIIFIDDSADKQRQKLIEFYLEVFSLPGKVISPKEFNDPNSLEI